MERNMEMCKNGLRLNVEYPPLPINSTVSCLLCWSPDVKHVYLNIKSAEGIEPLRRQLTHWFILRKVLEMPLECCEHYLLLLSSERGAGAVEEDWLQICTNCFQTFVQQFWQIHQQIGELVERRQRLQRKLKSKLKDGAVNCDNPMETSSVAMEIREGVVPGIENIVERRRMEQQDQVKIEVDDEIDEPEISDEDWQPMEEKDEELGTEEKKDSQLREAGLTPRKKGRRAKRFIYPCEQCSVPAFEVLEEFQRHQRLHAERKLVPAVDSNGQSLECQRCTFPAVDSQELMYHTRVRHEGMGWDQNNYECPVGSTHCSKAPGQWKVMLAHVTKMHSEEVKQQLFQRYLYCDQCPFQGKMPKHLLVHKRKKHGVEVQAPLLEVEQGFKCQDCDILCATQKELRTHVNNEHRRVNRFLCGVCGKGFMQECKLKDHEISHRQTREWVCHVCGADFPRENTLKLHLSKYHGPGKETKVYRCRYCDLTSPFGSVIRKHLQTHKEAGQWKCDRCGKFYMNKHGLLRHQKVSHDESGERVKCPHCQRDFPSKEHMRVHIKRYCKLKGSNQI